MVGLLLYYYCWQLLHLHALLWKVRKISHFSRIWDACCLETPELVETECWTRLSRKSRLHIIFLNWGRTSCLFRTCGKSQLDRVACLSVPANCKRKWSLVNNLFSVPAEHPCLPRALRNCFVWYILVIRNHIPGFFRRSYTLINNNIFQIQNTDESLFIGLPQPQH
jgi:hypothetical protein